MFANKNALPTNSEGDQAMNNKKIITITIFVLFMLLFTACTNKPNSDDNKIFENSVSNKANSGDAKSNGLSEETDENIISVSILGGQTLLIDKDRFNDDIYGTGQINNRWTLDEVDVILNSIKGEWKIGEYKGFVVSSIYYPDLFDQSANLEESVRNNLLKDYSQRINKAKNNIPNLLFSVKRYDGKNTNSNYIVVNENYLSPISIILSLDRMDENYPVFVDQTTLTMDFAVEYPVIFIKFFVKYETNGLKNRYEPATLVLTKDDKFYILMYGAFYSVVKK